MRRILALLLALAIAPGTWLRETPPPPSYELNLRFQPVPLPSRQELARQLGPFTLEAAWRMESPYAHFGGFSALVARGSGEFLAISDRGYLLRFSPPGAPPVASSIGPTLTGKEWRISGHDAEAATADSATGVIWLAWESDNQITRHGRHFGSPREVQPRAMRDWGVNAGPEAMVRLADGRFIVLREGFSGWFEDQRHKALLFAGDPIASGEPAQFTFVGPAGFSVTDMTQLPDGRVLVLMRKLTWPFPARFTGRIMVADPAEIRAGGTWQGTEVAQLALPLPVDNFEGLAIAPRADGKLTVWLISDDNNAAFQSSLLWKLVVDPADLPGASKKARGQTARPSAGPD